MKITMLANHTVGTFTLQEGTVYEALDGDALKAPLLKGRILVRHPDVPPDKDYYCVLTKKREGTLYTII